MSPPANKRRSSSEGVLPFPRTALRSSRWASTVSPSRTTCCSSQKDNGYFNLMRPKICRQSFPNTHFPVVLSTLFDGILQAKTKPQGHTTYHTHRLACLYAARHPPIFYVLFIQESTFTCMHVINTTYSYYIMYYLYIHTKLDCCICHVMD